MYPLFRQAYFYKASPSLLTKANVVVKLYRNAYGVVTTYCKSPLSDEAVRKFTVHVFDNTR